MSDQSLLHIPHVSVGETPKSVHFTAFAPYLSVDDVDLFQHFSRVIQFQLCLLKHEKKNSVQYRVRFIRHGLFK